jgi:hypothetical protein
MTEAANERPQDALMRELIRAVAYGRLVDAVLDDGGEP